MARRPHDFARLAALAYAVVDSGLDTGRPRQRAVTALTREVCRLIDAGVDFDALCEELGIAVGPDAYGRRVGIARPAVLDEAPR